jgi:hypothetical protein
MLRRGKTMIVGLAGLLAFAVMGAGLYSGRRWVQAHVHYWTGTSPLLPRSEEYRGELVDISCGEIEALEFLQFLADYSGRPVVLDSTVGQSVRRKIIVAAPMRDVTAEVVEAILEANRFLVTPKRFIEGDELTFVVELDPNGSPPLW